MSVLWEIFFMVSQTISSLLMKKQQQCSTHIRHVILSYVCGYSAQRFQEKNIVFHSRIQSLFVQQQFFWLSPRLYIHSKRTQQREERGRFLFKRKEENKMLKCSSSVLAVKLFAVHCKASSTSDTLSFLLHIVILLIGLMFILFSPFIVS